MIADELKRSILQKSTEGKLINQNINFNANIEINDILLDEKDNKKYEYKKIENVPFNIPSNWIWVKLDDICTKICDGTHSTPKYVCNGIPFISVKDVSGGSLNFKNCKYISKSEHELLFKRCNPEFGDILITKVGTTGVPVINDVKYQFSLFVSVALLKFNQDKIYNKFLLYFLQSPIVQEQVQDNTRGVGNKNWVINSIKNTIIPLPPLEEQQRIVDKIEELFKKLDEIKPIEEELSTLKLQFPIVMRKSIIDYAIKGKITHSIENICFEEIIDSNLYKENGKKFKLNLNKDDFPFKIPENWIWTKIGNLFSYKNGYAYKPSETSKIISDYPIIKSQNLMSLNVIIDSNTSYVENPNEKMLASKVNNGDFLMCLSSQSSNPEPLGKTAIYNLKYNALLNQRVLKLTPFNSIYSKFLFYVINSQYFHYTVSHKGGGSAQSNLKLEHVMEMYIPFPPIEEQNRIVKKLDRLLPLCDDIEKLVKDI